MEYIFEFILELLIECGVEANSSSKIPKYIRYSLIAIISLFFIVVIALIFFVGILSLEENMLLGIFLILIGLFMLIMSIIKFRKAYLVVTKNKL